MNIEELELLETDQQLSDRELLYVSRECDSIIVSRLLEVIDNLHAEQYAQQHMNIQLTKEEI